MNLSRRDRIALMIGGAALLVFVILQFILFPLLQRRDHLRRSLAARKTAIVRMTAMQGQYRQLNQRSSSLSARLAGRPRGFSLFSFLERQAAAGSVKKHVVSMKPSTLGGEGPFAQMMVEMKLKAVGLRQLVEFLKLVESPANLVVVRRLSIRENSRVPGTLDVLLQVMTIMEGEGRKR